MSDLTHLDGTPADAPSGWQGITDDTTAQWALTTLAAYTTERDRIRRNAQAEVERIQTKALADEAPVAAKIEHWTNELTGYLRRIRETNPKVKTYKLPGGNLVHRKGRTSTVVSDESEFVDWMLGGGLLGPLKITPQVSALTPAHGFSRNDDGTVVLTETGEPVPGVQVVTGDDSYTVNLETGTDQ